MALKRSKHRSARPRRRFSLGALLMLVAGVALLLAGWVVPSRRQAVAVTRLRELGGRVRYAYEPDNEERSRRYLEQIRGKQPSPTYDDRCRAPKFLVDWLGEDYFSPVVGVSLRGTLCDDVELQVLRELPALEEVDLSNVCYLTDQGLEVLSALPRLRRLDVSRNQYHTPQGESGLTDTALTHVAQCGRLQWLALSQNRFTDVGLQYLADLKDLEQVTIQGTGVSHQVVLNDLRVGRHSGILERASASPP